MYDRDFYSQYRVRYYNFIQYKKDIVILLSSIKYLIKILTSSITYYKEQPGSGGILK